MTTSVLCQTTKLQVAPANGVLPMGSQAVNPAGLSGLYNPQNQSFQLLVTCTAGNCSATAHVMVSNDGVNWTDYALTLAASSAVSPNSAIVEGTEPFQFYTAYIGAISGTGAQATVTMGT